jgi:hypothetical protein
MPPSAWACSFNSTPPVLIQKIETPACGLVFNQGTLMKFISFSASLLAISMAASSAYAKVSAQEALQIGKLLTAVGAEQKANANKSIPAYTGGLAQDTNVDPYKDIYANELPLFIISKINLAQYKSNLTSGQVAMFEKYPDTYTMPIYPTHRTANYPANILAKAKRNATSSTLLQGGDGLTNFDETMPFVIPKNGVEVIWNHQTRFRGGSVELNQAIISVERNGDFSPIKLRQKFSPPQYLVDGYDKQEDSNILFYMTAVTKSPARLTGNILLIHETIDQVKEPRKAWQYNAGQRRVRRAPQVAYDAPDNGDLRTVDQVDMYNGAPDRYNWKLIGKKEIYIPYNSYKLMDQNAKYKDIIKPGHINQQYTRYELHRTWHVQATLKQGTRHIYAKRDFYVDEDSWQIAVADHYDGRGQLWRMAEGHSMQFVNVNAPWYIAQTNYDLLSGRYMAELNNEERDAFVFGAQFKRKDFTTTELRRSGSR